MPKSQLDGPLYGGGVLLVLAHAQLSVCMLASSSTLPLLPPSLALRGACLRVVALTQADQRRRSLAKPERPSLIVLQFEGLPTGSPGNAPFPVTLPAEPVLPTAFSFPFRTLASVIRIVR